MTLNSVKLKLASERSYMGDMLMEGGANEGRRGEQHGHVHCLRRAQGLMHQEVKQAVRLWAAVKIQQRSSLVI